MKLWPFSRKKNVQTEPSCEIPIPSYLRPYWVTVEHKNDPQQITGNIRCACGCTAFRALRSNDDDRLWHAICRDCKNDILLFDVNQHGWDAIICGDRIDDMHAGESAAQCPKCSGDEFGVTVWVEPTDKQEFISCNENGLPESEWVNAYTWFAAHLTCVNCNHRLRDWADIETA